MKKNAFTLIELLAVIVILAIIALIAVPIVINIINDSKKSSDEQSVELYIDTVEKAITKKQLSNPNFNPDKCIIQSGGNLKCYKNNELIPGEIEVDMKGTLPSSGIVEIKNNKIKFRNIKYNNKKYYLANLVEDIGQNGISIGDKYTYDVIDNMEAPYTFYVLSIEKEKVNLILDRNICSDGTFASEKKPCKIAWYSKTNDNSSGPVTAMTVLYNATKEWINVPNMDLDYKDEGHIENSSYGYGKIETIKTGIKITKKDGTEVVRENNEIPVIMYEEGKTLKARLPKLEEVYNTGTDTNYCHDYVESCPAWLTNRLASYSIYYPNNVHYLDNEHIETIQGYWILASYSSNSDSARCLNFYGIISSEKTSIFTENGIRPVITVPREYLES